MKIQIDLRYSKENAAHPIYFVKVSLKLAIARKSVYIIFEVSKLNLSRRNGK